MHLTPEMLATGKENFYAAVGNNVRLAASEPTRRQVLLPRIREAQLDGNIPGWDYFGYESSVGSQGPLRVGVIGTGDEGSVLIGALNPDFIQVVSIADIRPYNQHRAFEGDYYSATARRVRPGLKKKYPDTWNTIKVYGPYQQLIEFAKADGVEAVIIALPLHLHAPAAVAAMRAGLHVLTEKLMGHSVHECKEMARVAAATGKHLATGHQRHYNVLYDHAVDLIRRGVLGELHYIRAQWHRGNLPGSDSWQQPMPESVKPSDPLAKKLGGDLAAWRKRLVAAEQAFDRAKSERDKAKYQKEIDKYKPLVAQVKAQIEDEQVKAADHGYVPKQIVDGEGRVVYDRPAMEELIRWRLWDRTGGGLMAELGSHQLDAASIFLAAVHGEKQYPISVAAAGNRPIFPPDREVEDHVYSLFEFPAEGYDAKDPKHDRDKIGVQYASINGNGYGGYGETVFGTRGTMMITRETDAYLWRTSDTLSKIKVGIEKAKDRDGKEHKVLGPLVDAGGDPESRAIGEAGCLGAGRGYQQQLEHWAWCVRKNPDNSDPDIHPRCYPKVALGDAVVALTTNVAAREGKRVEFDNRWFDVDDDATPEGVKPDISRYTG